MNKKTKTFFLLSIILSVLLIITAAAYIIKTNENNGLNTGILIFSISIICLAILSVLIVFLLRRKKEKQYESLGEDYRDVLDHIMLGIQSSNMNAISKKQVEDDLLDLFTQAAADGKKVNEVVDKNQEKFVEEIIKAHGAKHTFFTYVLSGLQYFIIYLFVAHLYEFSKHWNKSSSFFEVSVENSTIFLFALISFITIPVVMAVYRKTINRNRLNLLVISYIAVPVITFIGFILLMEFLPSQSSKSRIIDFLINQSTTIVSGLFSIIILISLFFIAMILKQMIQKHMLKHYFS